MGKMGKSRVDYNMKLFTAIAMVLVVSAHLDGGQTGLAGPYNLFRPYAFHVAAFVFVSGYFYKPASERDPWRYLVRKAKRLIVPLFLVSAVYGYVWVLARMAVGVSDVSLPTVQNLLIDPLINAPQYRFTAALWFLTPLFCTEVLNVLIRKALARVPWPSKTVREVVLFIAYLLLGAVSIVVGGTQGIEPSWLLLVCRTLLFVSFFGMGRFYREVPRQLHLHTLVVSLPPWHSGYLRGNHAGHCLPAAHLQAAGSGDWPEPGCAGHRQQLV